MLSQRQQAYMDAMDIGVWHLRNAPVPNAPDDPPPALEDAPGLKLGPGSGGVLLVCASDSDSASRLANDISRSLGGLPVWSWPDQNPDSVGLSQAVEENLFSTVAVFGDELAARFFATEIPASLKSANVVLLPAMQDIQKRAESRKSLWASFCRSGMVSTSDNKHR